MRGRLRGNATRGNYVAYGEFGLQALESKWLTARQIEAGRIAAQHFLRRQGDFGRLARQCTSWLASCVLGCMGLITCVW